MLYCSNRLSQILLGRLFKLLMCSVCLTSPSASKHRITRSYTDIWSSKAIEPRNARHWYSFTVTPEILVIGKPFEREFPVDCVVPLVCRMFTYFIEHVISTFFSSIIVVMDDQRVFLLKQVSTPTVKLSMTMCVDELISTKRRSFFSVAHSVVPLLCIWVKTRILKYLSKRLVCCFSGSPCSNRCQSPIALCDIRKYVHFHSWNGQAIISSIYHRVYTSLVLQKSGKTIADPSWRMHLSRSLSSSCQWVKCDILMSLYCFSPVHKMN